MDGEFAPDAMSEIEPRGDLISRSSSVPKSRGPITAEKPVRSRVRAQWWPFIFSSGDHFPQVYNRKRSLARARAGRLFVTRESLFPFGERRAADMGRLFIVSRIAHKSPLNTQTVTDTAEVRARAVSAPSMIRCVKICVAHTAFRSTLVLFCLCTSLNFYLSISLAECNVPRTKTSFRCRACAFFFRYFYSSIEQIERNR